MACRSKAHRLQRRSCVSSVGSEMNSLKATAKSGAGWNAARPSASTSTRLRIRSPRSTGEAGRDGAPENVPDQRGRRRAGALDQVVEPPEDAIGVERAADHLGRAVARQVRRDDAMGGHEIRDHPQPLGRVLSRAVQQNDRWAVTTFQHGGRHAVQLQPSLGDREP